MPQFPRARSTLLAVGGALGLCILLWWLTGSRSDNGLERAREFVAAGHYVQAEGVLRQSLAENPADADTLKLLVWLLRVEGRNRELAPYAMQLMRSGIFPRDALFPMGNPTRAWLDPGEFTHVERLVTGGTGDALCGLGAAVHALRVGEAPWAVDLLQRIVESHPRLVEARVRSWSSRDASSRFDRWNATLPPDAEEHPEVWAIRGRWFASRGQGSEASRCFREALLRDPNHLTATYVLSRNLRRIGEDHAASILAERAERLEELHRLLDSPLDADSIRRIVELLDALGRRWEAAAWCREGLRRSPGAHDLRTRRNALDADLGVDVPRTAFVLPTDRFADVPLPEWGPTHADGEEPSPGGNAAASDALNLVLVDEAADRGLVFRFENGSDPDSGRVFPFHYSGGAVAVLDYDADLSPDLFLVQGARGHDRLFRNRDGLFEPISDEAGTAGDDYGQGVAVGDFDNDGFPDLFVANIGANRLYHNNGDGTFEEVSAAVGLEDEVWSQGGVLADLDGDTAPDLYVVNYVGGPDATSRRCIERGRPIQCPIDLFPPEADRFHRNLGDGTFVSSSDAPRIEGGRGMGVLAGHLRGERMELLVANDMTPNLLLSASEKTDEPFSSHGVAAGIAYGAEGRAESGMGVAAADVDGDGRLDFVVTNFVGESNNLYLQFEDGLFEDVASSNGLAGSRPWMGWGSQFTDVDLDNRPDLLVANGHLDRNTARGGPFRMPAQLLHNEGNGRFEPCSAGRYFRERHAGRAVARLDCNRDGREDLCITRADAPVALLVNRTASERRGLVLRLRGTRSSRDAIGAVVRARIAGRWVTRHLLAGGGFAADNERSLVFGVGGGARMERLEIRWPSGVLEEFSVPPLSRDLLLVEGSGAIELPGGR